jgi:hypothetical protein
LPVIAQEREGLHAGELQKALVNLTPLRANASRLGLSTIAP